MAHTSACGTTKHDPWQTRHPRIHANGSRGQAALPPGHAAVANGRTMFPSTVWDAKDVPRVLVAGENNRKIGDRIAKGPWAGFRVFTLTLEERATCPASCGLLRECFGNGMHLARRVAHGPVLIERLDAKLRHHARENPGGFAVRVHVLGDFYDLEYLRAWVHWMRDIPQLHVWGYTAHAPASRLGALIEEANEWWPDRWVVRFSRNPTPGGEPGLREATTVWAGDDGALPALAPGSLMCPTSLDKTACCATCGLCWSPEMAATRIVFLGHGLANRRAGARYVDPIEDLQPQEVTMTEAAQAVPTLDELLEAVRVAAQRNGANVEAAREEGYQEGLRAGTVAGRLEARAEWQARIRAMLDDDGNPDRFWPKLSDAERAEVAVAGPGPIIAVPAGTPIERQEVTTKVPAVPAEDPPEPEPAPVPAAPVAAPQRPVAPPPPLNPVPTTPRTPARKVILEREWPQGTAQAEIAEEMNALPGPYIPAKDVMAWAMELRLLRGPVAPRLARTPAPASAPAAVLAPSQAPKLPAPTNGVIRAAFSEIKAWAAHHGIRYDGSNLDKINQQRKAWRQPMLVQDEDRTAMIDGVR